MKEFENNAYFWQKLDAILLSGDFKVAYKKGKKHPKYSGLVFPCDYGHVQTDSKDSQSSLKVMKGAGSKVCGLVICANLLEKNVSVITLVGMNEEEENAVLSFLNQTEYQKTVIIKRGKNVPDWAQAE